MTWGAMAGAASFVSQPVVDDFSPVDVPDLIVWFDGSDASTLFQDSAKTTPVASDGDPVGAMADKSGNGRDAVQATGADQPSYQTNEVNGQSLVEFASDFLRTAAFTEQAQPNTLFFVLSSSSFGTDQTILDGRATGKRHLFFYDNIKELAISAGTLITSSGLNYDITQLSLFTAKFDGASSSLRANGIEVLTGNPGTNPITGVTLGDNFAGTSLFNGKLCEYLLYHAISDSDRNRVEAYLTDKWLSQISVTSPSSYQVFQRNGSGQADIAISGTYQGTPSSIEARFNGGSWVTIDASPSAGAFGGTLPAQAAGQGALEVRFTNKTNVADSVAFVGVGDVFVIAGQSNASGRGTNSQVYTHATLKAGLFKNDYSWVELADPTDANPTTDTVSDDSSAAGSCWPLVATEIMAAQGVPVAFVPTSTGGTGIADWQKGTDNDRATLYGSMQYRAGQVGGVKAVLWWQGERNAVLGTSQAVYNSGLDDLAADIQVDLGVGIMACKLQDMSTYLTGYDESIVNAAIAEAWGDNPNVLQGPDFSDITPSVDGVHFVTDGELVTAASRWWTAIQAELY